ncbi:MAG: substrate-binding domain-containing protein [Actinomycetota bacterium]
MSSSLPSSQQRLVTMLVVAIVVAVAGVVIDSFREEEETVAATTTAPVEEEVATPVEEMVSELVMTGLSTTHPLAEVQAARFQELAPGVAITVELATSEESAARFCAGEVVAANTFRLMTEDEIAVCADAGIEFIELRRAVDAVVAVTSPGNDAVECISFNDLYALMSSEAQGFAAWSDANALTAEWGGTEFADGLALDVTGPSPDSATMDSFIGIVLDAVAAGESGLDPASRDFVTTVRDDYAVADDATAVASAVAGSTSALGFMDFLSADEAADAEQVQLIRVSVDDGGTCLSPNEETVAAAAFPVSRFVYTYVSVAAVEGDEAVEAFFDYALSDEGLAVVDEVRYLDLVEADASRASLVWRAKLPGQGQWEE